MEYKKKKKQGGTGAPWYGDKGSPYKRGERIPRSSQTDIPGLRTPKSEALRKKIEKMKYGK